jgi:hypothetical protein
MGEEGATVEDSETAPEHPVRTVVKRRMEKLVQRGIATLVIGLLLLWIMAGTAAVLFTLS